MRINRSTLARNSATSAAAIRNDGAGAMLITNSTIASNSASQATGGILTNSGTSNPTTLRNTIVGGNHDTSGFPDFNGRFDSQGYNLIGNSRGIVAVTGDRTANQRDVAPRLGRLQDNGGPTLTKALLPDSPAIDRGDAGYTIKDQRGFARPMDDPARPNAKNGDGSDIGAFELQTGDAPAGVADGE